MSKIWDEREKALEDEYFLRKEHELIERLRAKRAENQERDQTKASPVQCPKCDGALVEIAFEEVQIDRCGKCNGVWLDAEELEKLTRQEGVWLSSLWKSLAG